MKGVKRGRLGGIFYLSNNRRPLLDTGQDDPVWTTISRPPKHSTKWWTVDLRLSGCSARTRKPL